jgi:hypothetical protein
MLWLRKGFGFTGEWTVCEQNGLLARCFGLKMVNETRNALSANPYGDSLRRLRHAPPHRLELLPFDDRRERSLRSVVYDILGARSYSDESVRPDRQN